MYYNIIYFYLYINSRIEHTLYRLTTSFPDKKYFLLYEVRLQAFSSRFFIDDGRHGQFVVFPTNKNVVCSYNIVLHVEYFSYHTFTRTVRYFERYFEESLKHSERDRSFMFLYVQYHYGLLTKVQYIITSSTIQSMRSFYMATQLTVCNALLLFWYQRYSWK